MKSTRALGIAIIQALMRSRTTINDLAAMADTDPKTARLWVQSLQRAGLVRPQGSVRVSRTGCKAILWEWHER